MRAHTLGLFLAVAGALAGCKSDENAPKLAMGSSELVYREIKPGQSLGHDEQIRVLLDTWQVSAPAGSITGNPKFWAGTSPLGTLDEQRRFEANGIRAATMPLSEWDSAKKAMEEAPAVMSQPGTLAGPAKGTLQTRDIQRATIFYYDRDCALRGRTFDDSQLFWSIFWASEPANPTTIRLDASPVVRSKRRQVKLTRTGDGYEVDYIQPETICDLTLSAKLPLGDVLILSPTASAAKSPSSLGRALMMVDDAGVLNEHVVFIYPRGYRYNARASDEAQRKADEKSQPR